MLHASWQRRPSGQAVQAGPCHEHVLQVLWHLRPELVHAAGTNAVSTRSHADGKNLATLTMEWDVELDCLAPAPVQTGWI